MKLIALKPALRVRVLFVGALLIGACVSHTAYAQQRVALVIGNSAYSSVPALPNPVNDAGDIARALSGIGFNVTELDNANFDSMRRGFVEFGRRARGAETAVVFFAGHGMEIGGDNWLIPVDAELRADTDAAAEAIDLRFVMGQVAGASKLGLIILDACRNNPFDRMQRTYRTRAVERGFTRVEPSTDNVAIVYASRDGTTAADGQGRNSPFSAALLKHLAAPPRDVRLLFGGVRDDVVAATHGQQQPFIYQSLPGSEIYLRPPQTTATPTVVPTTQALTAAVQPAISTAVRDVRQDYEVADRLNSVDGWDAFLLQHPSGSYSQVARDRKSALVQVKNDEPAYNAAKRQNTVESWDTFLLQHPDSFLAQSARDQREALLRLKEMPKRTR